MSIPLNPKLASDDLMDAASELSVSNIDEYVQRAEAWNSLTLQPWKISSLVRTDKIYAVLEKKHLQFELQDWFDDTRIGAVMRGEKIVSEAEFWHQLYRQSVDTIQQHFKGIPIRITDTFPGGKSVLLWGNKSLLATTPPKNSSVASQQPLRNNRKKRRPSP